jgi:predicted CDP-diglyceride synthetase/phosphatidate cytidylyltransferase
MDSSKASIAKTELHSPNFGYKDAINLTKNILQKRARSYWNMVVVLGLLLLIVFITSLWFWSMIPLAYLLLFWPAYSLFLLFDQLKIYAWKEVCLSAWQA